MTIPEAKAILLLYRPGVGDELDPQMAAALSLARSEPELAKWFAEHCKFQAAMRVKLRSVTPPPELLGRILAERKVIRPPLWRRTPVWLAAAAAFVVLLGVAFALLRPPPPDRFADFRARMVRTALREYRMDIVTNDMAQVRAFLAARGAPADYEVTPGLAKLPLTGGGLLQWRGHPVSMVCFDRGDREMLFLFVMDGAAAKDAPPAMPQAEQVNKLSTLSWTQDGKAYLLAGPPEGGFKQKYF
jgi:hypothetical protein